MKHSLILLLAIGMGHAAAQSSGADPEATLRKLLARVESLEAEVRQLRTEKALAPAASGKETVPLAESAAAALDGVPGRGTFPQLKLRGFGDVSYHWSDGGQQRNAFRLGQPDLFLTSQLAENLSVLSENVIEADDTEHFGFEVERLLLQYTPREYFNVAVGRYHTAIGYYNNAYHHGKWLQTAAERPHIYDFEDSGGLLPIHNVGVSVSGAITPDFEWLNEGVLVRDASDRGTFTTFGFYTQIARRFGLFRPCVRYEYLSESARDPIVLLAGRPGRAQLLSLGVRYDFSELAALKLQWERAFVGRDDGARNELTLQLSFTF